MYTFLLILFVLACALMVVTILLQSSKGQGLAASFGGMGAASAFGPRGAASFLQRVTIILALVYALLCIFINIYGSSGTTGQDSILQRELNQVERTLPEAPLPLPGDQQQQQPQQPEPEE
jgi:preprotein translocase subunit SecG